MAATLMNIGIRVFVFIAALTVCIAPISARGPQAIPSAAQVRIVADEAEAVLAILAKKRANEAITESDWQRLFSSEGYVRLKKREASFKREFKDSEFQSFVLSSDLAGRASALEDTLAKWRNADVGAAAGRAFLYLPPQARIRAKIYPEIKPQTNSFVFEVDTDPAIFLYIDPTVAKEKFENTLAHELHHIGYGGSCGSERDPSRIRKLEEGARNVVEWIGAFGEGFAMLAAAGGPDIHPHATSNAEDRARWDRDVANFSDDLKRLERFFLDVLADKLTADQRRETAFSFFGVQGPWYTVGWKMAVVIEKAFGRERLIQCMCDQRTLLATYNEAAIKHNRSSHETLALWSAPLIEGIKGGPQ